MIESFVTIVICVVGAILGLLLMRGYRESLGFRLAVAAAFAPAVGFGLLSISYFFLRLVLKIAPTVTTILIGFALFCLVFVLLGRTKRELPAVTGDSHRVSLGLIVGLVLMITTMIFVVDAYRRWERTWHYGTADAVNIWVARARMIVKADTDVKERFRLMQKGHPGYPLFLPTAIASQFVLSGTESPDVARLTGTVFFVGVGLLVGIAVAGYGSASLALPAASAVLATPILWRWAFAQTADVPMAYLTLAATVGLAGLLSPSGKPLRRIPPILTGFALGLLPWTKDEGLVLLGVLMMAFVLTVFFGRRQVKLRFRQVFQLVMGMLPGAAALVFFKLVWAPGSEIQKYLSGEPLTRILQGDRWAMIVEHMVRQFHPISGFSYWGAIWPLIVVTAVWAAFSSRRRIQLPALFAFGAFGLSLAVYFGIYLLTAEDLSWHLRSLPRLLLQIYPLAAVGALWLVVGEEEF